MILIIHKSLGITIYAYYNALNNINYDTIVSPIRVYERSKDSKFKELTILLFSYSEESSLIDSNYQRIVPPNIKGIEEQHLSHVLNA